MHSLCAVRTSAANITENKLVSTAWFSFLTTLYAESVEGVAALVVQLSISDILSMRVLMFQTSAAYMLLYQRRDVTDRVKAGELDHSGFMDSLMSPRGTSTSFNYDREGVDEDSDDEDDSNMMDTS